MLEGRFVRIVALRAVEDNPWRRPSSRSLAMGSTGPVLSLAAVALGANLIAVIEMNRRPVERLELGHRFLTVAGRAIHHALFRVLESQSDQCALRGSDACLFTSVASGSL